MLIRATSDDSGSDIPDLVLTVASAAEWHHALIADKMMPIWVIFYNIPAHPGKFVARACAVPEDGDGGLRGLRESTGILIADSLVTLRTRLPYGLTRYGRVDGEDWTIIERWVS